MIQKHGSLKTSNLVAEKCQTHPKNKEIYHDLKFLDSFLGVHVFVMKKQPTEFGVSRGPCFCLYLRFLEARVFVSCRV